MQFKKSFVALLLGGLLTAGTSSSAYAQGNLERATTAALQGPEAKKLKIGGHEFHVKPAKVDRQRGRTTIEGQISHCLTARTDDQVYYANCTAVASLNQYSVLTDDKWFHALQDSYLQSTSLANVRRSFQFVADPC